VSAVTKMADKTKRKQASVSLLHPTDTEAACEHMYRGFT